MQQCLLVTACTIADLRLHFQRLVYVISRFVLLLLLLTKAGFSAPAGNLSTPSNPSNQLGGLRPPSRARAGPGRQLVTQNDDLRSETHCLRYETTTYRPKHGVRYTKGRLPVRNGSSAIRNDDLRSETRRSLYETMTYSPKQRVRYTKRRFTVQNGCSLHKTMIYVRKRFVRYTKR